MNSKWTKLVLKEPIIIPISDPNQRQIDQPGLQTSGDDTDLDRNQW